MGIRSSSKTRRSAATQLRDISPVIEASLVNTAFIWKIDGTALVFFKPPILHFQRFTSGRPRKPSVRKPTSRSVWRLAQQRSGPSAIGSKARSADGGGVRRRTLEEPGKLDSVQLVRVFGSREASRVQVTLQHNYGATVLIGDND